MSFQGIVFGSQSSPSKRAKAHRRSVSLDWTLTLTMQSLSSLLALLLTPSWALRIAPIGSTASRARPLTMSATEPPRHLGCTV